MQELITFRVSNKEEGEAAAGRGAARGEIVIPQVSKKRATPTTTPRAESDGMMGWISAFANAVSHTILNSPLGRTAAARAAKSPTSSSLAKDFSIYNRDDMTRRILLAHKFILDNLDWG